MHQYYNKAKSDVDQNPPNCKLVWQNSNWNKIRPADKLEPDPLICPNKNMGMGKSFLDY